MHKRLLQALVSVSSVSSQAKSLAGQLITEATPELVQTLQAKIVELEARVSELTMQLIPIDEELSDKESLEIFTMFVRSIAEVGEDQLRLYNKQYLYPYQKPVRLILATALRNRAVELQIHPLDAWVDIIALDGEIK